MTDANMITLKNKVTGELKTVPRSQYIEKQPSTGFSGIGSDIQQSLSNALPSIADMIAGMIRDAGGAAKYATSTNPVSTLANLGAGGVEAGAGLLSAPQVFSRYIADKFPAIGKRMTDSTAGLGSSFNDPTFYEALNKFEQEGGLAPQSPDEASVRNVGGLLFGGKGLSTLGSMPARAAAISGEATGRGGDPIQAALLSVLGEMGAKGTAKGINRLAGNKPATQAPSLTPGGANVTANISAAPVGSEYMTAISNIPKAALNIGKTAAKAVEKVPEMAGKATAKTLETIADQSENLPVVGKAVSGIAQPTLGALGAYLKHISVAPEELAKRNLFDDIDPEDLETMIERDAAGKRLGLTYLTPSELTDSPFESVKQGNVGRTTQGSKLLYKRGQVREASEEAAINKLLDSIHTDKLNPQMRSAYEQTMQSSVPDDFVSTQSARPVIEKAQKSVANNTAYKQMLQEEYGVNDIDSVPKNSFMYWDMVKRVLGDMEQKAKRAGKNTEASAYANTRRSMVQQMDNIEPQYQVARNIAERNFTRKKLEDVFDKKDKTFNNFYSFLKSDKNYNEMVNKLSAFPEALQQLQDIKMFAGNLIPNNPTIRAAAALKRTGMSDARNALEAKKREYDEKYGQEHDVAGVKLMTNPNLMSILSDYLKEKGKI